MTTPRDDIAGLSERLRISLAGVAREESGGDNLAILLASYFEPSIEDEELDDSGTWKQGALDACDKVLDAIHAHYATQLDSLLKERDALQARVKELEKYFAKLTDMAKESEALRKNALAAAEQWQARAIRAEQERDEAMADSARLDFLDQMNSRLNAHYGTTYKWELILNHNVNRLMLKHLSVDLNDAKAHGLKSCRDAIDAEMKRLGFSHDLVRRLAGPEKA